MNTVLDNQQKLAQVDKSNMLGDLAKTPDYCRDAIKRAKQVDVPKKVNPKNVIVVGMGGSAIGGELLKCWLQDQLPIPVEVCRDYVLPAYVDGDSLVFVNSYSGNTEETISAFLEAVERKCTVIVITSGGLLEQFCKKLDVPHVIVPSKLQPRVAVPYLFFSLPVLLQKLGLIANIDAELKETIQVIEKVGKANAPDVLTQENTAKQVAQSLLGTVPVVYAYREYLAVANRIKCQFNENSKIPSKFEAFPELNHNETVGYDAPETLTKTFSVLLVRDPHEPVELKNRVDATSKLVFKKADKVLELTAQGTSKLAKMFSVIVVGDYASVYLAILQNKDPSPVQIIDKVKSELAKRSGMKQKFEAKLEKL
ncbi:MAG: bifunctional phosphoglucose/phosphomannose isomerase [Candidatus Bathyarchaeota archaeon]|nr:bifunctional phosphoglucose/phosphomannose isomerase [Candidatus Bathyarchaeota archaeon]